MSFAVMEKADAPAPHRKGRPSTTDWAAVGEALRAGKVVALPARRDNRGRLNAAWAYNALRYHGIRVQTWHIDETLYVEAKS